MEWLLGTEMGLFAFSSIVFLIAFLIICALFSLATLGHKLFHFIFGDEEDDNNSSKKNKKVTKQD